MAEAAKALALGEYDWAAKDLELKREGEAIVLPNIPGEMPIDEGIRQLKRIKAAEEMEYDINENIQVHFFDGLVALYHVLKEKYGYAGTTQGTVKTMFGPMKVPPKLLHVKTGPSPMDFVQVPFGGFNFPGVDGTIETKYAMSKGIPVLSIQGTVKSKEKKIVMEIVTAVKAYAENNSIYKGRAIILERDEGNKGINFDEPLQFFNPNVGYEVPIFDKETELLIDTAVMAPIQNAATCRKMGIPLKRGVLLEGPYGTGKSLTSRQAARIANENNWTFILVSAATALRYGLQFAKMYQPCVVFAEDIDRVMGNRNEGANDLINDIDGVVGKNDEIITVLTTNFAEKIDKSMLRPGRLDAVISLRPPQADAVERLIRFYGKGYIAEDVDLTEACAKLAGNIPATIREVVERSKLSMIVHGRQSITAEDLNVSARGMQNHLDLLNNASEGQHAPTIDDVLHELIGKSLKEMYETF